MNDPTYDRSVIDENPEWNLAFVLSEIMNDDAPLGWGKYITTAACLRDNYTIMPKAAASPVSESEPREICGDDYFGDVCGMPKGHKGSHVTSDLKLSWSAVSPSGGAPSDEPSNETLNEWATWNGGSANVHLHTRKRLAAALLCERAVVSALHAECLRERAARLVAETALREIAKGKGHILLQRAKDAEAGSGDAT